MTALDRDKAREVLRHPYGPEDNWDWDLDRLEECVHPPRPFVVHSEEDFRGRIRAEAKLARIADLCDASDSEGDITVHAVRAVLDGGAA